MRYFWNIGDIKFCASQYGKGWLLWGTFGISEVLEEKYREGSIEEIMDYTSFWVRSYSESMYKAALKFEFEEFL